MTSEMSQPRTLKTSSTKNLIINSIVDYIGIDDLSFLLGTDRYGICHEIIYQTRIALSIARELAPMENKKVKFVDDENDKENADGVRGHLEAVGEVDYQDGLYDGFFRRLIDIVISFMGLVILSPVYLIIAITIKIDDPGPVFFAQKRVGKNKQYFKLHKFRSMKMATPHDVPTHMLENPEQYITKVGGSARRHSLDELPQVWDIFIGNMSIIGPRPALWNQDVLTSERDKWGANDIKPGLTGWAQINGRDELKIPVKAKLDGDYAAKLKMGGFGAFAFDVKCFFGTIFSVLRSDGVVESGTGEMKKGKADL